MREEATLELFGFLRVLAVALGRGVVTGRQGSVATFVALSCNGTSGEGATVAAADIASELGVSERTVWRDFDDLRSAGWFAQTAKPTRGVKGRPGRRARYRLTHPRLDLSLDDRLSPLRAEMADDSADALQSSDRSAANRLTPRDNSSDRVGRQAGTVLPSYGPPSDGSPSPIHAPTVPTGHVREAPVVAVAG